ncbi:MAG TPA: acyl carrier protein [Solirubrobacterales bacterium]|nr:acyl carrier protein [Solirubrobacterales bacterium]
MPVKADPQSAEKVIVEGLAEVGADPSEITREATFEALDVDSLDLVEIAQIVEDEFGIELVGDDVQGLKTVGDVIDLVVRKAA